MSEENFKNYVQCISLIIKDNAKKSKSEADNSKEEDSDYNTGYLMAYHEVVAIMKNQAFAFGLDQKDIELADIEPEKDLL